jgi:ribosomal-protein-alanine N-acetyltransferase
MIRRQTATSDAATDSATHAASGAAAGPAPDPGVLRAMVIDDLDAVCQIEQRAYSFPWSRGNFTDSLATGHLCWMLQAAPAPGRGRAGQAATPALGYCVAMAGVEEMHLLNITVRPEDQGRGHARHLLASLVAHCRQVRAAQLWLEVRETNHRARALYTRFGFETVGMRRAYYPAAAGREDAIVMRLATGAAA